MNDGDIVQLYMKRDQQAVRESQRKYGHYCYAIAYNILESHEDADESVNETWLGAWNSIPPSLPRRLHAFFGKITRRVSLSKWRNGHRAKRGGGQTALALEELAECVSCADNPESEAERRALLQTVNHFLESLKESERNVFVRRYWYLDSIQAIAERFGFTESKVKSMLFRARNRLRAILEREGYL